MIRRLYCVFLTIIHSSGFRLLLRRLFNMLMNDLDSGALRRFIEWIFSIFGDE